RWRHFFSRRLGGWVRRGFRLGGWVRRGFRLGGGRGLGFRSRLFLGQSGRLFLRLPPLLLHALIHHVRILFGVHHHFIGLFLVEAGKLGQPRGIRASNVIIREEAFLDERS